MYTELYCNWKKSSIPLTSGQNYKIQSPVIQGALIRNQDLSEWVRYGSERLIDT
jgi:hypothetical protein